MAKLSCVLAVVVMAGWTCPAIALKVCFRRNFHFSSRIRLIFVANGNFARLEIFRRGRTFLRRFWALCQSELNKTQAQCITLYLVPLDRIWASSDAKYVVLTRRALDPYQIIFSG